MFKQRISILNYLYEFFPTDVSNIIIKYYYCLEGISYSFINHLYFNSIHKTISCITTSFDGQVVCGSFCGALNIWNAVEPGHTQTKKCNTICTDGTSILCIDTLIDGRIITGSLDTKLKIWNTKTSQQSNPKGECDSILSGHSDAIKYVDVIDDRQIVSCSIDGTTRMWDLQTGNSKVIFSGRHNPTSCIITLFDGRISFGSSDKTIKIWNPRTEKYEIIFSGHTGLVKCICVLSNKYIVSGSADNTIKIWNLHSWDSTKEIPQTRNCDFTFTGHTASVNCIAILPDGRFVSGSDDKTLRIWNPLTKKCDNTFNEAHKNSIKYIAVLPSGQIISSDEHTIKIWS
jgi:WD40 repeat protein